jgi:hypothetical protein
VQGGSFPLGACYRSARSCGAGVRSGRRWSRCRSVRWSGSRVRARWAASRSSAAWACCQSRRRPSWCRPGSAPSSSAAVSSRACPARSRVAWRQRGPSRRGSVDVRGRPWAGPRWRQPGPGEWLALTSAVNPPPNAGRALADADQWGLACQQRVGWQPSRFLADRGEAERAFALAERLGSVNAAAAQLGTTWPWLRKAFTRHGLGMPARNPQAVRQRAIAAARQRSGRPATPSLDPGFVALNHSQIPHPGTVGRGSGRAGAPRRGLRGPRRPGGSGTAHQKPRRQPTTRAWAITRRAQRAHHRHLDREQRGERHRAGRAERTSRPHQPQERDGCRCPLTPPTPTSSTASSGTAPTWPPTWTACPSAGWPSCWALGQQPVGLPKLADDLLRGVASSLHRVLPPVGRSDSHTS